MATIVIIIYVMPNVVQVGRPVKENTINIGVHVLLPVSRFSKN
jgi:hypothetical protein